MKALQDWDYCKQCALRGQEHDPFIVTTKRTIDREIIQGVVEEWRSESLYLEQRMDSGDFLVSKLEEARHPFSRLEKDLGKVGKLAEARDEDNINLFRGPRNVLNRKEALERFLQRVGMAFIGGAFLIGPMILMVLHKGLLTTLLTTSICVFAFGLVMAMFLDRPFDVLSATAAYAAVLVVFVGSSSVGSGG